MVDEPEQLNVNDHLEVWSRVWLGHGNVLALQYMHRNIGTPRDTCIGREIFTSVRGEQASKQRRKLARAFRLRIDVVLCESTVEDTMFVNKFSKKESKHQWGRIR